MNLSLTNNERLLKSETQAKRKEKLPTFLGVSKPRFLTRLRAAPRRGDSAGPAARALVSDLPSPRRVYTFNFTQSSIRTENQGARWGWQGPGSDTRHTPREQAHPLCDPPAPRRPRGAAPQDRFLTRLPRPEGLRAGAFLEARPCGFGCHAVREEAEAAGTVKRCCKKGRRRRGGRVRGCGEARGPGADGLAPAPGAAACGRPASAP